MVEQLERILPDVVYIWFAMLLLTGSTGVSRIVGWVVVPVLFGLELAILVGAQIGIDVPFMKVTIFAPFIWLLIESIKRPASATETARRFGRGSRRGHAPPDPRCRREPAATSTAAVTADAGPRPPSFRGMLRARPAHRPQEGVRDRMAVARQPCHGAASTSRCFSSLHDLVGDRGVGLNFGPSTSRPATGDALVSVTAGSRGAHRRRLHRGLGHDVEAGADIGVDRTDLTERDGPDALEVGIAGLSRAAAAGGRRRS